MKIITHTSWQLLYHILIFKYILYECIKQYTIYIYIYYTISEFYCAYIHIFPINLNLALYIDSYSRCAMVLFIACVTGRFGFDCNKKCHCENVTEDCQAANGPCKSGCAQHYTGGTCQGNAALTA